nr:hypothetical protein [Tanacetum cinerariifolium]
MNVKVFRDILNRTDVIVDHLHQPYRTFASIINKCLCGKEDLAYQIDNKDSKKQDKIFYPRFTNIIIHHFLKKDKSISMRNRMFMHTAQDDSLMGTMRFVSRNEDAQIYGYKTKQKRLRISQANGSGDETDFESGVPDEQQHKTSSADEGSGTKPRVLDVPKYISKNENESWRDSDDDVTKDDDEDDVESDPNHDNEASDSEMTESDEDKNLNLNSNDDEEEEKEEYDVRTPDSIEFNYNDEVYDELYKDVNVSTFQEKSYEQVIEDAHVTLTSSQKIEGSKQSSSVSSDFASKFLNLDNVPPVIDEVASMMNVKTPHEESITQLSSHTQQNFKKKAQAKKEKYIDIIEKSMKEIIKDEVKSQLPHILPKEISNFATSVIQSTINESLENVDLAKSSFQPQSTYKAAQSLTEFELKKILLDKLEKSKSYRAAQQHRDLYDSLRGHEDKDKDKDEDPLAGSDQGLKKRKMSKDAKPSRGSKSKESKSSSSKGSKSQSKSSCKSAQAEEPVFETVDTEMPKDQGDDMGTCKIRVQLEFHFEECYKAVTDKLDWHNPEGHEYPFDLSNLLPFIEDQGHQVVPANYFFNNDLKYLKDGNSSAKYTTSTTKTKAARYDNIEGIKDMVQTLRSPVKKSLHDVFSTKRIIAVTHVNVVKKYDYEYLDEITIRREDYKLYKFKEDDIFDLNVALWMFTRCVVILKRVEDLQMGVESYQRKLNITKPEIFRFNVNKMTLYTAYNDLQGIIYQEKLKRNRLMYLDELYRFFDGTLSSVRRVLHDIASSLEMDYLPKRI